MAFENLTLANSQFIPTYSGIPLEELERSANVLQDRYYQNLANTNQIELALEQQPYLPQDETIRESLRTDLQSAIKGIADTGGDYENATRRVQNLSKAFLTDPRRLQVERNHQAVQQEIELENKLRAQGKTPLRTSRRENFSSIDPNTGELRQFESDLQPQLDYDKRMQSLFDNIRASSGPLRLVDLSDREKSVLKGYLKTGQITGIGEGKIKKYLQDAFNRYRGTEEYKQQKYFDVPDEDIANQLLSVGLERSFIQTKENLVRDLQATGKTSAEGLTPYDYEEDGSIEVRTTLPNADDFKIKSRRRIARPTIEGEIDTEEELQVPGLGASPFSVRDEYVGRDVGLTEEELSRFKTITDQLAGSDATDAERQKAYENYVSKVDKRTVSNKILTGDFVRVGEEGRSTREDAAKDANANYDTRTFWDVEQGELIQGNSESFLEDHLNEGDSQIEVVGDYDIKNNFLHITGNAAFADAQAIRIDGKKYLMSRSAGNLLSPRGQLHQMINQVYNASSLLPNIWAPLEIRGLKIEVKQNINLDNPNSAPTSYSIREGNKEYNALSVEQALTTFINKRKSE